MPRGKYLSDVEKGKILALSEEGFSLRRIGQKLNRSHVTVGNFLRDPVNYGTKKNGGPKKKMSLRETRGLIKAASNTFKSLKRLKSDLKLNVCRSTICRCLKVAGQLKHSKPISAPKLLPRHKAARLQFVRANMSRDWSKVIKKIIVSLL